MRSHFIQTLFALCVFLYGLQEGEGRELPKLTGAVVDEANLLSSSAKEEIENALRSFYSDTRKQIQLVTIQSLEGEVLEAFSIRLAEHWKIGKEETDEGVIFLIAAEDRKMRIEVGGGLEGEITDAQARRIIEDMKPFFKKGKYGEGIVLGLSSVATLLGGKLEVPGTIHQKRWDSDGLLFKFIFFLIAIFFGLFFYAGPGRNKRSGYFHHVFWGGRWSGRGWSGRGGFFGGSGGFSGGGGWSGGGGGFSGGGASGGW